MNKLLGLGEAIIMMCIAAVFTECGEGWISREGRRVGQDVWYARCGYGEWLKVVRGAFHLEGSDLNERCCHITKCAQNWTGSRPSLKTNSCEHGREVVNFRTACFTQRSRKVMRRRVCFVFRYLLYDCDLSSFLFWFVITQSCYTSIHNDWWVVRCVCVVKRRFERHTISKSLSSMKTSCFLSDATGREFFLSILNNFELFLFVV
jgi:hypothetical protein